MHREVSLECSLEVGKLFGSMWVDLLDDGKHGERKELRGEQPRESTAFKAAVDGVREVRVSVGGEMVV